MQQLLFGVAEPSLDRSLRRLTRVDLGAGAWIDHVPGWVSGDGQMFRSLRRSMSWQACRRPMYERVVDVPRLLASIPEHGPGHPLIPVMASVLSRRYERALWRHSLALYRDGRDSVAWHGDRVTNRHDALVAVVSLGSPRRFLVRPKGGGASRSFPAGHGTLIVMGGTAQATFEHCVPKVASAEPRLCIMLREAGTALASDVRRRRSG